MTIPDFIRRIGTLSEDDPYEVVLTRQVLITAVVSLFFLHGYYYVYQYLYHAPGMSLYNAQRELTRVFCWLILLQIGTVLWFKRHRVVPGVYRFLIQPDHAFNLGIFRLVISFFLLTDVAFIYNSYNFWLAIPDAPRVSLPFMGWFIQHVPITPELYQGLFWVSVVSGITSLVGWQTRASLVVFTCSAFYVCGVPNFFGKMNHNQIIIWLSAILAVSPCGDACSLDRMLLKQREPLAPSARYGFPLKIIGLLLGVVYFSSGFHKLWDNGLHWALTDSAWNQFRMEWVEHYDTLPIFRIDQYPNLCRIGALLVIAWELLFVFMLFSRHLRLAALLGGVCMHTITGLFLYIFFSIVVVTYSSQIDWWGMLGRFRKWEQPAAAKLLPTRAQWLTGGVLVVVNLAFGLFQVHSWPFSSYPSYSNLVPGTIRSVTFLATTPAGAPLDVYAEARAVRFKKENYRRFEDQLIEGLRINPDTLQHAQVKLYWQIWQQHVPVLQNARLTAAFLDETSLEPEKRHIRIRRDTLYYDVRPTTRSAP
jgi:hypothetical protein